MASWLVPTKIRKDKIRKLNFVFWVKYKNISFSYAHMQFITIKPTIIEVYNIYTLESKCMQDIRVEHIVTQRS